MLPWQFQTKLLCNQVSQQPTVQWFIFLKGSWPGWYLARTGRKPTEENTSSEIGIWPWLLSWHHIMPLLFSTSCSIVSADPLCVTGTGVRIERMFGKGLRQRKRAGQAKVRRILRDKGRERWCEKKIWQGYNLWFYVWVDCFMRTQMFRRNHRCEAAERSHIGCQRQKNRQEVKNKPAAVSDGYIPLSFPQQWMRGRSNRCAASRATWWTAVLLSIPGHSLC